MGAAGSQGRLGILHIGPMKTGSTSIQWWLSRNSAALEAEGVHLLRPKAINASALVRTFEDGGRSRRKRKEAGNAVSPERFNAVLEAIPDSAHTAILSGELLGQAMRRPAIARLKEAMSPYFDRWLIIVYLRRQADLTASRFSTSARRGQHAKLKSPMDYARILEEWGAEFGRDSLRPRLFDRAELIDGDVVADFQAVAGLPTLPEEKRPDERNPSLNPKAQAFLEDLAKSAGRRGPKFLALPGHSRIVGILNQGHAGSGRMPSRAEVAAFMDQARDSNEVVRAAWFPERTTLFSEDYSKFPEVATPAPSNKDKLEVAMDVIVKLMSNQKPRGAKSSSAAQTKGDREARRAARKARKKGAAADA